VTRAAASYARAAAAHERAYRDGPPETDAECEECGRPCAEDAVVCPRCEPEPECCDAAAHGQHCECW
jgi:hypothetical protein